MAHADLRGLYAVTPEYADGARLLADVAAALRGGCRLLQYRDKDMPMPVTTRSARALRVVTRAHGARLLINDDLALCLLVGADGVHLGKDDGSLALARALLGPQRLLGASCYDDFPAAAAAARAGADYVAFGAFFPSPTKPLAARATVDLLARAKSELGVATCAIGGITLASAPALTAAGADLLAVVTDLFGAPDIAAQATAYQHLFEDPQP
jgi:thiamine-phosphate pyrophosphorylase